MSFNLIEGDVVLRDENGNPVGVVLDDTVYRLQVEAKLSVNAGEEIGYVRVWDGTDILDILTEAVATSGLNGVLPLAKDGTGDSTFLLAETDGALIVANKPPSAPPGTTEFNFAVDDAELNVGAGGDVASPHETVSTVIGAGVDLYLQTVEAGTEGDSSENGSVVELYWREGAGPTDHLVSRFYMSGQTIQVVLPNVHYTRDGTEMVGNGTNTYLVVTRRRLSVSGQEIDFVVRGYTV